MKNEQLQNTTTGRGFFTKERGQQHDPHLTKEFDEQQYYESLFDQYAKEQGLVNDDRSRGRADGAKERGKSPSNLLRGYGESKFSVAFQKSQYQKTPTMIQPPSFNQSQNDIMKHATTPTSRLNKRKSNIQTPVAGQFSGQKGSLNYGFRDLANPAANEQKKPWQKQRQATANRRDRLKKTQSDTNVLIGPLRDENKHTKTEETQIQNSTMDEETKGSQVIGDDELDELDKLIVRRNEKIEKGEEDDMGRDREYSIVDPEKYYQLTFVRQHEPNVAPTPKSDGEIRNTFLNKLAQKQVWVPPQSKPKTHQTCIIFDWDDTLLCTSYLAPYEGFITEGELWLDDTTWQWIHDLEAEVINILQKALATGQCFIITNAAEGWVEQSAYKLMPEVYKVVTDPENNIKIISARTLFEHAIPNNVEVWKKKAFLLTLTQLESHAITNILALGDSQFEMDAAVHLASQFKKAFIKTIKFREAPSPQELTKQLKLVMASFDEICKAAKNQTVRLQRFPRAQDDMPVSPESGSAVPPQTSYGNWNVGGAPGGTRPGAMHAGSISKSPTAEKKKGFFSGFKFGGTMGYAQTSGNYIPKSGPKLDQLQRQRAASSNAANKSVMVVASSSLV